MKKFAILMVVLGAVPITIATVILLQAITSQENSNRTIQDKTLSSENYKVTYSGEGFDPKQITVPRGTRVTFENSTPLPLYVASDPHPDHTNYSEFDAGVVLKRLPEPGEDFSFTFDKPGIWKYHNHTAPEHMGTVIVD